MNFVEGAALLARADRAINQQGQQQQAITYYLRAYVRFGPELATSAASAIRLVARSAPASPLDPPADDGLPAPSPQEHCIATALVLAVGFDEPDGPDRLASLATLVAKGGAAGAATVIMAWRLLRSVGKRDAANKLAAETLTIDSGIRRNRLALRGIRQAFGALPVDDAEPMIEELARKLRLTGTAIYSVTELGGKSRGVRYVRRHGFASRANGGGSLSLIEKCFDTDSAPGIAEETFYRAGFTSDGATIWAAPGLIAIVVDEDRRRLFLQDVGRAEAPEDSTTRFAALTDAAAQFAVDTAGSDDLPLERTSAETIIEWLVDAAGELEGVSREPAIVSDQTLVSLIKDLDKIIAHRDRLSELAAVPLALGHGDLHPGNIIWLGTVPCIIDWGHFGYRPLGWDLSWCFWGDLVYSEPASHNELRHHLAGQFVDSVQAGGVPPWRSGRADMVRDILWMTALGALKVAFERRILVRLLAAAGRKSLDWNRAETRRVLRLALVARHLAETLSAEAGTDVGNLLAVR